MSAGADGAGAAAAGLADLYGDLILDHNRRPRHFGALADATHQARGDNPLCGDQVTVYLRLAGDRIEAMSFTGAGCAISTASASMMVEALNGRSLAEARRLFASFHALLTGRGANPETADGGAEDGAALGKLEAFSGVREFPMRVKCATLAWHALQAALAGAEGEGA